MIRVLMVCLGNICRSPLAEGLLRSKLDTSIFEIDSAGTSTYHQGSLPDQRSIEVASKYGLDITNQKSRPFTKKDFQSFDYIYVMDSSNYEDVINMADNKEEEDKVNLILNTIYPGENQSVPDPYHDSINGFEQVYHMLDESCSVIASELA
ncbi:low molecular weight phosphotyrosine protein phosphatase [Psychroflexus gondwanensis]|jgi:protein-tyrosine phosphatase|uniref:low molecular weight protein-tyrosine-phosphatase n=1 Tax=Psychroflexus gondwanensis TaxID=251 RepID=UPI0011BEB635|nr:low molecular weight protein-tyrosine-phosphatase [Psychroflexus gondwanensis]TXE19827.1 low molecular weight phosphotyrosine protein phosphatase [Psychroflexus gondwanensis]